MSRRKETDLKEGDNVATRFIVVCKVLRVPRPSPQKMTGIVSSYFRTFFHLAYKCCTLSLQKIAKRVENTNA